MSKTILSSKWDGLSPHLIAQFYQCDKYGVMIPDSVEVHAPLTESNMDITLNWQSPFEQSGPDSVAPTLYAMMQSGAITDIIDSVNVPGVDTSNLRNFAHGLEGKTGITKLNSIQTFSGMPPIKIQVTALFRAWFNAKTEVEDPVNKLIMWALPVDLANTGAIAAAGNAATGAGSFSDVILPSVAPTLVGMIYKGREYAPLVIESIGFPINSPITSQKNYTELSVPMTLCTLAAIDRFDFQFMSVG
jgi:hypothetical protein